MRSSTFTLFVMCGLLLASMAVAYREIPKGDLLAARQRSSDTEKKYITARKAWSRGQTGRVSDEEKLRLHNEMEAALEDMEAQAQETEYLSENYHGFLAAQEEADAKGTGTRAKLRKAAGPRAIQVTSATYGHRLLADNSKVKNNLLKYTQSKCEGKMDCQMAVDIEAAGVQPPSDDTHMLDLHVTYKCVKKGSEILLTANADARWGSVTLSCGPTSYIYDDATSAL